jgi:putative ABC transport system ATP-binding protein
MSGGEQQRVAIARALISSPKLLLADEPTGNLDRQTGIEVLQLLLDLASQEKSAVLLATHNESVASQCSRTLRLHGGRLESME